MTPPEVFAAIKDVLLAVAGATTAIVAVVGLKSWGRELRGRASFETARALIRATYKLRDEIEACRSPFIFAQEFPEEYRSQGLQRTRRQESDGFAHIYANRWAPVWAALQEFDTQTLEAEALWGIPIRVKTDVLRQCVRELRSAIDAVISGAGRDARQSSTDPEFESKIEKAAFAAPNDNTNELSLKIKEATNGIEAEVRPHLRRG